uniref:septation protein SepH n=1 Tax=unclassified Frankia TaxID=2632575 RepID=UPI002AD2A64F
MRELRAVALSEDGGYLVLADTAGGPDAEKFRVPVDDRLRAALRGARRSEVRQESALTPREIQARLRAGETTAEVARVAGIPVERVERYEGPVLAERARVVQEARAALLPKDPGGAPGRPLGEVVDARLMAAQDDPDGAQWDAWRRVDGIWLVQLTSESRCARWTWDPVVRRVRPHDDAARALVTPEVPAEPAAPPLPTPLPTQTGTTRPPGPALTLVQEPVPAPVAPVAHPPVAVPPPTPVQPAAARGRTHGVSRPAARGEAPA